MLSNLNQGTQIATSNSDFLTKIMTSIKITKEIPGWHMPETPLVSNPCG